MAGGTVDMAEMRRHVEKTAALELSLDFDEHVADLAKKRRRHRNIVDAGRGFAVAFQPPPQDQLVITRYVGLGKPVPAGMVGGGMEDGGDLGRRFPLTDQAEVGAAAKSEAERIEQD